MKRLMLTMLILCVAVNVTSCAKQDVEQKAVVKMEQAVEQLAAVKAQLREVEKELAAKDSAQTEALVYLNVAEVSVSSFDSTPDWAPPPEPEAVIDGSLLSRWSSDYKDNQWVRLDFGKPKVLSKLTIFWEAAYAVDYDVLTSEDGANWQPVLSLSNQDGGTDELEFAPTHLRYLKVLVKTRVNPQWGVSVWELLCFGPPEENPTDKSLAIVFPQLANRLKGEEVTQIKLDIETPQASPGAISFDEFQKGVVYTSWSNTELGTEASDRTLEYLKEIGVTYLGIMVVWYQDDIDSQIIFPDPKDTPEDQALVHAINKAHSLGIKVMLKPHVDVKTDQWRGDIIPSAEWFASYKMFMTHYVRLAAQYNVELFSVGTELVNVTMPKWLGQWEALIDEIKGLYSGLLVYSANWDEYQDVGFWHKLDFIGIDAYFPLTEKKDPTKDELIASWHSHAQGIEQWLKQKKINKPIIFTEVGYCSADGTNTQPWAVLSNLSEAFIDQEEQASCLDAMLMAGRKYPWFKGFYWWNFFPQRRWSPLGYTIRGKEAEVVFVNWMKKL
ncbi:discoidin domain-containing protein [Candidatus Omnitrophota bacterium]